MRNHGDVLDAPFAKGNAHRDSIEQPGAVDRIGNVSRVIGVPPRSTLNLNAAVDWFHR